MQMLMPDSLLKQKLNVIKLLNAKRMPNRKERFVFKALLKINVLLQLFGIITPVTLHPLECKNLIRHLNGSNDKILNNLHNSTTFTRLEDLNCEEKFEQFQNPFTVHKFIKCNTGTFNCMPAVRKRIYGPLRNPFLTVLLTTNLKLILIVDLQYLKINTFMMILKTL